MVIQHYYFECSFKKACAVNFDPSNGEMGNFYALVPLCETCTRTNTIALTKIILMSQKMPVITGRYS